MLCWTTPEGLAPLWKKNLLSVPLATVVVPTVTESFITETMVNNALTKKQHGKHKPDVNIGNIHYNQSQSFINNSKI